MDDEHYFKPWPLGRLFVLWLVFLLFVITSAPIVATPKINADTVYVLGVSIFYLLRLVLAAVKKDRGYGFALYIILLISSPFVISIIVEIFYPNNSSLNMIIR